MKNPSDEYKKETQQENWRKFKSKNVEKIRERDMQYRVKKKAEQDALKMKLDAAQKEIAILQSTGSSSREINVMDRLPPDSVVEFLKR